jgi:hypothetical protein
MSTKSLTFSAVDQQTDALVVAAGQNASYSLSGTFEATLVLQRKINNGPWVTLVESVDDEIASTSLAPQDQSASYRWLCTAYTSGDPVGTISDVATQIEAWVAQDGSKPLIIEEDGITATIKSSTVTAQSVVSQTISGILTMTGKEDTLTAHAGGTQAAALALSASVPVHIITVCATAADSVKLPTCVAGEIHIVWNFGAESAQVFGNGTSTINGVATATGVALPAGKGAIFYGRTAGAAGAWLMILGA